MTFVRRIAMKLSKRDRILLGALAALVVLGGGWWFYVKPASAELKTQRAELERVSVERADARDALGRLRADYQSEVKRTAERLRTAKALPDTVGAAGTIVQLERLAERANVELAGIQSNTATVYGGVTGYEYEVKIQGRFFDVDDFLYRMHRQVAVDEDGKPIVGGRLFAITGVDMTPKGDESAVGSGSGEILAVLRVVAFSTTPAGAATTPGTTTPATTQPVANTATPTGAAQ
ncbi:MAG: hypothetical protein QOD86_508 [Miltoncostaeaceae bacterium]|jgi:hypothetical protein|nr:hypothetical protein [Miltoncostaeaceae bacterium]